MVFIWEIIESFNVTPLNKIKPKIIRNTEITIYIYIYIVISFYLYKNKIINKCCLRIIVKLLTDLNDRRLT